MAQDADLPRQIKLDYREAGLNPKDRAMLDYAAKVARERWNIEPGDHERLRSVGFSDADILDITLVVANFMLANTLTDACGLEFHENFNAVFGEQAPSFDDTAPPSGESWVGRARPVIRALDGDEGVWFNSAPLTLEGLLGRPVLVYFWDWTHPGSLEGLPYLAAWHERYADHGLTVILVLAPEFPFAKEPGAAADAVRRLGITLPVVLDARFRTWRGANNAFWPAMHLIDAKGTLRWRHHGPGGFTAVEEELQRVLRESHADLFLPPVLEPLDPMHQPRARLLQPTPQLYAVYEKGRLANREAEGAEGRTVAFSGGDVEGEGLLYIHGEWCVLPEGLELIRAPGTLTVRYRGARVSAVLGCSTRPAHVEVRLDGHAPGPEAGADVRNGELVVPRSGPHELISGPFGLHELRLTAQTPGFRAHLFTFRPAPAPAATREPVIEIA